MNTEVPAQAGEGASLSAAADEALRATLAVQVRQMLAALAGLKRPLYSLIVAVVLVLVLTAYGQVRLNSWNKPFFDALSRRDLRDLFYQLGVFGVIAGCLLALNVAQRWLVETLKLRLREALVKDLIALWMLPRRALWLSGSGDLGVNPDQRMHEDARKLCELSGDLGVGLLQAGILFVTFAGILWTLSADFSIHFGTADHHVPGFMLWAAILYAGFGSLLSYRVGRSLILRNADRYAREADLRFSLVRVNEHLDAISTAGGEADERRRVELSLIDVLAAMRRLITGLTNLTWVTAGFGWITIVAPILVAAPLYFGGKISFGGLMMAAAAFTQAQSSLRWFVDNFSTIADWRATLLRVASFRLALTLQDTTAPGDGIARSEGEGGHLRIERLEIESPGGRDRIAEPKIDIAAGERVLIVGDPGTGRSLLFRALAGLWPWGGGSIRLPGQESILFIPRGTPYLPRGRLREVLAYPHPDSLYGDAEYQQALLRMGLEHLVPKLDLELRWERELSVDEQTGLTFARMVLQAPRWLIIDELLDGLEKAVLRRVADIFEHELSQSAIVHIGRAAEVGELSFGRVLHLVKAGRPAKSAP